MTRRAFTLLLTMVLCLSAHATFAEAKKVACVGDSITKAARPKAYPTQLASMLGEKWDVKGFGRNGATALKKGNRPYVKASAYTKAIAFKPDVVVIMLGTNDSKPSNWKHKADFVADYLALIKSFRELDSKPAVWLCYPPPAYSSGWGISDKTIKEELIPLIDQIAKKAGARIIDMYVALSDKKELFPKDGIHPGQGGAKVIAETVAAALRR